MMVMIMARLTPRTPKTCHRKMMGKRMAPLTAPKLGEEGGWVWEQGGLETRRRTRCAKPAQPARSAEVTADGRAGPRTHAQGTHAGARELPPGEALAAATGHAAREVRQDGHGRQRRRTRWRRGGGASCALGVDAGAPMPVRLVRLRGEIVRSRQKRQIKHNEFSHRPSRPVLTSGYFRGLQSNPLPCPS